MLGVVFFEDVHLQLALSQNMCCIADSLQVYPDGHEYLRDATPTASVVASDVIAAQLHPNGLGPRAAMMAALAKASDELASGIDVDTARAASGRTADRNSKGKGADVFVIKLWCVPTLIEGICRSDYVHWKSQA